jgi:DNA-directed RNA polymerase II subunit RPB1
MIFILEFIIILIIIFYHIIKMQPIKKPVYSTAGRRVTNKSNIRLATRRFNQNVRPPPIETTPTAGFTGMTFLSEMPENNILKINRQEKKLTEDFTRRQLEALPTLQIDSIIFKLFSYEELVLDSYATVTNTNSEGLHSVNDKAMGVVANDDSCLTCMKSNIDCQGHYGRIDFNRWINHPSFQREIIDILSSVCNSCGSLLLNADEIKEKGIDGLTGLKRLRALAKECKDQPCRRSAHNIQQGSLGCTPNPVYKTSRAKNVGQIMYHIAGKDETEALRTAKEIFNIFNAIPDEDVYLIGFKNGGHPKNMILRGFPVIPPCARAPVIVEGQIKEDHLTKMYKDIVRYNLAIIDPKLSENDVAKAEKALEFAVAHLIDNTDGKYAQGPQNPYVSISQRVNGKDAIIRAALMGKRTNFSGRTVISPDPTLNVGEIRIPEDMAPFLTVHATVNVNNIEELNRLLKDGKIIRLIPVDGKRRGHEIKVDAKVIRETALQPGDQVDRYLQNGDYVVFNRQPTLHRYSIMGYKVVLGKQKTIGLHPSVCKAHNADFDGDEGNIHAPQSPEVICEVASFMNVINNIMTAQSNKNIIGVILDGVAGSYLMTKFNLAFNNEEYNEFISAIKNKTSHKTLEARLRLRNIPKMCGRGVFSALFPEGFEYQKEDVIIEDGILVQGAITNDNVGSAGGSIIQVMYKDFGRDRTVDFISDIYFLMNKFTTRFPLTVGLGDCIIPTADNRDPQAEIQKFIQNAKLEVATMGGKFEDPLAEERREKTIQEKLNTAATLGVRISKELIPEWNAFILMIVSGSKGSTYNLAQIIAILGQQFQLGKRMPESISGGTRCLPYFEKNDLDPEARGYIVNSFMHGLTPPQLFFHQAGGRVGLMDTANKTSETGYIHHRMVKALEDVKVTHDGSVRSASGSIFQYTYGDDGFDASMLESIRTKSGSFATFINIKRSVNKINTSFGFPSVPVHTGELSASVIYEVDQVYMVDSREATVLSVGQRSVPLVASTLNINATPNRPEVTSLIPGNVTVGGLKKEEMVQFVFNDNDEMVWKKPSEIGQFVLHPSKFVNVYNVNGRDAYILNSSISGFNIQYDDGTVETVDASFPVIPGGYYIIRGRQGIATNILYTYQVKYIDNGDIESVSMTNIGAPIRRTQI